MHTEFVVIGAGAVGSAIAYGLAGRGRAVIVGLYRVRPRLKPVTFGELAVLDTVDAAS